MKRFRRQVESRESRVQSQTGAGISLALVSRLSTLDSSRRLGATLSEILMSILIMSIGVVSLATLFPISVLRSIQASQLTNATIHRLNAEELIGLFPRLVHNPDNDLNPNNTPNLAEHERPGTIDNPNGDGVNEGRFIVDPMGANSPNLGALIRPFFGNNAPAATGTIPAHNPISRYDGGFLSMAEAMNRSTSSDTWQLAAKGPVAASTANSITVGANVDLDTALLALSGASATNPVYVRVMLFPANGKQSVTRDLTAAMINSATRTIDWTALGQPFPASMGTITRFRLEIFNPRYSWLLSVRKTANPANYGTGTAAVDVVVVHNRGVSQANEQVYQTTEQGFLQSGNNRFVLNLAPAIYPAGSSLKPFLKKGGYIFDAQHGHWYRIAHVTNETTSLPIVTIDRPAVRTTHYLMTMPGVVDVFPIGSVPYNPNNAP